MLNSALLSTYDESPGRLAPLSLSVHLLRIRPSETSDNKRPRRLVLRDRRCIDIEKIQSAARPPIVPPATVERRVCALIYIWVHIYMAVCLSSLSTRRLWESNYFYEWGVTGTIVGREAFRAASRVRMPETMIHGSSERRRWRIRSGRRPSSPLPTCAHDSPWIFADRCADPRPGALRGHCCWYLFLRTFFVPFQRPGRRCFYSRRKNRWCYSDVMGSPSSSVMSRGRLINRFRSGGMRSAVRRSAKKQLG